MNISTCRFTCKLAGLLFTLDMTTASFELPTDLAAAHTMILAARATHVDDQAHVAYLRLEIEKLKRELYGISSERKARL